MAEPPPNLAQLKLPEWVRQHPVKSYYPDDGPSAAGMVGHTALHAGLEILGLVVRRLHPLAPLATVVEGLLNYSQREELPARRREAQREAFRKLMWEKFWTNEALYDSSAAREAAFDKLVGDNVGHGIAPELTQQAEAKRQELIDQINDRWLERMGPINELQQRLEAVEKSKPSAADELEHQRNLGGSPIFGGSLQEGWASRVEHARKELESYTTAMGNEAARDVQSVKDFESKPANWALTPEQQSMLTSRMQPEESDKRSDDDKFYDVVGGRP